MWAFLSLAAATGLLTAACTAAAPPLAPASSPASVQPAAAPAAPTTAPKLADVTVTDVVGRTVTIKQPIERAILSEGRMMYIIAALEKEDPFKRLVGWVDDLRTTDFDAYEKYKAKFLSMANVKVFGSPAQGQFSAEQEISGHINQLYALAVQERDYASETFLQWFVAEQVEEEKTVRQIVETLKMTGGQGHALLLLDRELKRPSAKHLLFHQP